MRLPLDHLGKIKNYIHIGQGAILFLAWALTIALLTRDGSTDGRVGWYFGLVRPPLSPVWLSFTNAPSSHSVG